MAAFQHPVVNLENKPAGTVDLLPEVFKLEELNNHLIWEAVRHFLAKQPVGGDDLGLAAGVDLRMIEDKEMVAIGVERIGVAARCARARRGGSRSS